MNEIKIFDTTLRDGEQTPGCKLDTRQKIHLALKLENLGVDIIEAGFPISSPGDFQSVLEISKAIKESVVCGLSRAVNKDIETAARALAPAKRPRIHTGIGTSPCHMKYKLKMNEEQILDRAIGCVKLAKSYIEDVEFYAEDAGRTDNGFLARVIEQVIKAGATVVNIPDTTGHCLPEEYGQKIKYLLDHVPNIDKAVISTHCHNDLGLATANSIAGIQNGARQIECTINGIGERAGNTSLEEVVMIINHRLSDQYNCGIITEKLKPMSDCISEVMGVVVQANKAIVGSNAFSHSSGIHQDGLIKHRANYEIMDPLSVGANPSKIVLTARSGRAALAYKARQLGYELTKNELDGKYQDFLKLADLRKEVKENDLEQLLSGKKIQAIVESYG